MKKKINKGKYERVIDEIEINIPEQPMYFFHTGIRRMYSVIPEWTTWNKKNYKKDEEVWRFKIIVVDPSNKIIEAHQIPVNFFEKIINKSDHPFNKLIENMVFCPDENTRTKEQFMEDYNNTLTNINENII